MLQRQVMYVNIEEKCRFGSIGSFLRLLVLKKYDILLKITVSIDKYSARNQRFVMRFHQCIFAK